jgi:hypothetical protein
MNQPRRAIQTPGLVNLKFFVGRERFMSLTTTLIRKDGEP